MTVPTVSADLHPPTFHQDSESLRFWVSLPSGARIGATLPRRVLFQRYGARADGSDAVTIYEAHRAAIDAAVVRRVAAGSIEPVMLREYDLLTNPV